MQGPIQGIFRGSHDIELDEIILSLALGSVVISWFAYRRWRELNSELKKSNKLNTRLTTALEARKKAQTALSACWRRFVDIAELSPDWIWECDENLLTTYLSERFSDVTGVPREKIIGKIRMVDVTDSISDWDSHLADLEARRPFRDFSYIVTKLDGETQNWMISGTPVFDEADAFKGYHGIGIINAASDEVSDDMSQQYRARLEEFINLAVMEEVAADGEKDDVHLTPREAEILDWVKSGKSYSEIAEILSISRRTVEFHSRNVMNKLGASNRVSAVVIAMRRGILGS